jgi:hypothetical protein
MKRWMLLAANLYPRGWRERYGEEIDALIEDSGASWRDLADVARGGLTMQMKMGSGHLKLIAALAVAGAAAAGVAGFTAPRNYVSTAVVRVPKQREVRLAVDGKVVDMLADMKLESLLFNPFSETALDSIIKDKRLGLYEVEQRRMRWEDLLLKMRRDIQITRVAAPGMPAAVRISFAYPDKEKARAVAAQLATRLVAHDHGMNRDRAILLRHFVSQSASASPADDLEVVQAASLPDTSSGPNRAAFMAAGLGAGLLLGLLVVAVMRRPKRALWMAAVAAGGGALAVGISFLLPVTYTSTATLQMAPPDVPERLPDITAASMTAQLQRVVREALGPASLAEIIQSPWLDLYKEERASKPLKEIVERMRTRDVRVFQPYSPAIGLSSVPRARISFSYRDPAKAREALNRIVEKVFMRNVAIMRDRVKNFKPEDEVRVLMESGAGDTLEIVDPASLPAPAGRPDRLLMAATGLAAGLLLGALALFIRRRRSLEPRTA